MSDLDKALLLRDAMDDVFSPTFCFAKWYHTTIYLQTGMTHSCYHPAPHKIPLEGLAENPSMLHNTPHQLFVLTIVNTLGPHHFLYSFDNKGLRNLHNQWMYHF